MSNEFKIGTTDFKQAQSKTFAKKKWFKLAPGNNHFRILPPMWSLATGNRPYKYWRTHFGFATTEGNKVPIPCIERTNKEKEILENCPICDMVNEAQREYDYMKNNNTDEKTLLAFEAARIAPYRAGGGYYVWALDAEGTIGVLKMPKTVKEAYEERHVEAANDGILLDGVNGCYINIKRSGEGKFNTRYTVDIVYETDPSNPKSKIPKEHVLTTEFIARLQKDTTDLAKLYTPLAREEMALLANETDVAEQGKLMDKLFSRSVNKAETGFSTSSSTSVPGTNAYVTTRTALNTETQRMETTATDMPVSERQLAAQRAQAAPAAALAQSETLASVQTQAAPTASTGKPGAKWKTDEEFKAYMENFSNRFGKQ